MNKIEELNALTSEICDRHGFAGVGISYFKQYAVALSEFTFAEILDCLRDYHHDYVVDFILGTPFLWQHQPMEFWPRLITRPGRRDRTRTIDDVADFADVEFLCRYVKIDALAFLINSSYVQYLDKLHTVTYLKRFPSALVPDVLDAENLDGTYSVNIEVLTSLRTRLCDEIGFEPIKYTRETVNQYVRQLYDQLTRE